MFHLFRLLIILLLPAALFGQQRISFDANTRLNDFNFTVRYMKVVRKPFLLSAGICFGHYGVSSINYDSLDAVYDRNYTPYSAMNHTYIDTNGTNYLMNYNSKVTGIGIDLGVGYYHEFSVIHGIRFNLNARLLFASNLISSYYSDLKKVAANISGTRHVYHHFSEAIMPEIYHTIRIGGRSTFYYGLKIPYYFSFDKNQYHPRVNDDSLYAFEIDLAIGLTFQVGQCE